MSEIKNSRLDQYGAIGAEPYKQLQFETAGTEGVKPMSLCVLAGNTIANHSTILT